MKPEVMLAIGVGAAGFILGIINLFWGPKLLARRLKVEIHEPTLKAELIKRTNERSSTYIERIFIGADFKLVRTRGEDDVYLKSAYVSLDKELCQQLDHVFNMPPDDKIYWTKSTYRNIGESREDWLKKLQPMPLAIAVSFDRKEALSNLNKVVLKDLEEKVKQLESKYKIYWIDSKENERSYRLPHNRWAKFVPERFWWRI